MLNQDPLWYKDAVFYELHVRAFFDNNDDGIGDFAGLINKLDYLEWLGVDCLWLLPFYPSPLRDDGYDVADFRSIAPSYGTTEDFRRLLQEAHRRGMRVIVDLILNHTSDQHAWFQSARSSPDSPDQGLLCLEQYGSEVCSGQDHFRGYREIQLDVGPGSAGVFLASVFQPSTGSQL